MAHYSYFWHDELLPKDWPCFIIRFVIIYIWCDLYSTLLCFFGFYSFSQNKDNDNKRAVSFHVYFQVFYKIYQTICPRTDIDDVYKTISKTETISASKLIEFLNEKQRDARLNQILYPEYDQKRVNNKSKQNHHKIISPSSRSSSMTSMTQYDPVWPEEGEQQITIKAKSPSKHNLGQVVEIISKYEPDETNVKEKQLSKVK